MKSGNYKIVATIVCLLAFVLMYSDVHAQTRGTKPRTSTRKSSRDVAPKVSPLDKINYEIKLGNLGIGGNVFSIAAKLNGGYKLTSWFTAGAGIKSQYEYLNYPSGFQDYSGLDFGGFAFVRGKITKSIYLQGEYGIQSYQTNTRVNGGSSNRFTAPNPAVGGGYIGGGDRWSYGAEVLFNINDRAQDYYGIVEYWINFSYRF
ncbi:MAG: hypothetical protein KDC49_12560 [Saprospiraceae bacterium]|nr:hypothetical protein [Saprospiraceae bacterium]